MVQLAEIRPTSLLISQNRDILSPRQEKARIEHQQTILKEGRILPESHEFSATLNRAAKKLGLPSQDVEIWAVDTEEPNAYYTLESKVIAATRGLFREIISKFESDEFRTQFNYPKNFHFSEDHIAAVLAHELEHARVLGDKYVEQLSLSWKDRLLSMFSHAEEYRADAEAVRNRLANAGYNPWALVDVLRSFGLTTGRDDIAHPEISDRVGKLELELADDKRPIANATKPLQELSGSLVEWFKADSDVYQQTEELIHATPQELREQLGRASSQKEFWRTYISLQHAERIVIAQAFVDQNRELLIQLVKNHMIVSVLRRNSSIGNRLTNPDVHLNDDSRIVSIITQYHVRSSGPDTVYMPNGSSLLTTEEARSTLFSRVRKLNQLLASSDFAEWQRRITEYNDVLDTEIEKCFGELRTGKLSPDMERLIPDLAGKQITSDSLARIALLEELFRRPMNEANLMQDEQFFRLAFSDLDTDYQNEIGRIQAESKAKEGKRAPDTSTAKSTNLHDHQSRQSLLNQVLLGIGLQFKTTSTPTVEMEQQLAVCICNDSELPYEAGEILSKIMLSGVDTATWPTYLATVPRDQLALITLQAQKIISTRQLPLYSPLRLLHLSHQDSLSALGLTSRGEPYEFNQYRTGKDATLQNIPGREIHRRVLGEYYSQHPSLFPNWYSERTFQPGELREAGTRQIFTHYDELTLSVDEVQALIASHADVDIKGAAFVWLTKHYVRNVQQGIIDTKLNTLLRELNTTYNLYVSLSPTEFYTLILNSPWDSLEDTWSKLDGISYFDWKGLDDEKRAIFPRRGDPAEEYTSMFMVFKHLYDAYPQLSQVYRENIRFLDRNQLTAFMVDVLAQQYVLEDNISPAQALTRSLITLTKSGIDIDYKRITHDAKEIFAVLPDEQIAILQGFLVQQPQLTENQRYLQENLTLLSLLSMDERKQLLHKYPTSLDEEIAGENNSYKGDTILVPETVGKIIAIQGEDAIEWILKSFPHQTSRRDILLIGVTQFAQGEMQERLMRRLEQVALGNPDAFGVSSPRFPFLEYREAKKSEQYAQQQGKPVDPATKEFLTRCKGEGSFLGTPEIYDDLLRRRIPFSTLAMSAPEALEIGFIGETTAWYKQQLHGSITQGFGALKLVQVERILFDTTFGFNQRLQRLLATANQPSVVRDIYLEELLLREFSKPETTNKQKIILAEHVFPLFTANSQLRTPFAVDVLKERIAETPGMLGEFDVFQRILLSYFPKPSLARNYFLDVWENSRFTLNPSQLKAINELRLSDEGKQHEADDSPLVFLFDRLSEVNRAEKIITLNWLLGISQEKSIPIKNIESEFDGHLDNLPKAFAALTPNEREVLLYRLLLGAEGILDLQTVPDDRRPQAEQQRKEFLETIGTKFFGDTPNPSLFQNMFTTMSTASTPAHATQVLARLINQTYEAELQQRTLSPEEALTIALTEMGVVGKKIAQYVAELDWIKQYPEYQRALRKAQEEGPVVPRSALLAFAEAEGLLDSAKPYSIIEFGPSLGSASNKQANLVTVEVRNPDNNLGLPVGKYQLVYKVMRPSAQKGNLGHDLRVLQAVYSALPRDQIAGKLPTDFLLEIEDTVTRELNFPAEQVFNAKMRVALELRNHGKEIPITMPRIVLATDNSMLETIASGKSLRTIYDLQEASPDAQREIMLHKIEEAVLIESLSQILDGNFHVDLHPGNIFVDYDEVAATVRQISFIDWGMREELTASEKQPTVNLLIALATGDEVSLKQSMQQLGWTNAEAITLELQATGNYPQDFAQNALKLLTTTRNLEGVPRTLMSVILTTAKLETYAHHVDPSIVLTALMSYFTHI